MEEVYVIKLKGIPSTTTSETSTTVDSHDLLRMSSLGLGVLHSIFGTLVIIFGALRSTADGEPNETIFGTLFGPIFLATGVSAIVSFKRPFKTVKMKVLFGLSLLSTFGSTAYLTLCFLGVIYFHSVPRTIGDSAKITANAIVAAFGELVVSILTVFTAGSSIWQVFQFGAFRPHIPHRQLRQRVIVKTNIVGTGTSPEGFLDEDIIKHISPNCVISLRATDEQREVVRRVQEYVRDLHSQDDVSYTFSDVSSTVTEQDLGVDSQNWKNEVFTMANQSISSNDINDTNK